MFGERTFVSSAFRTRATRLNAATKQTVASVSVLLSLEKGGVASVPLLSVLVIGGVASVSVLSVSVKKFLPSD